ncbi:MAG TPA: hypothetical protein VMW77_04370 [Methanoregula sp.]|nr:hypothetical protein [Methanoregula sp.]
MPVPCHYPSLRLAMVSYCIFWSYRIPGRDCGGKPKAKSPLIVRIRH